MKKHRASGSGELTGPVAGSKKDCAHFARDGATEEKHEKMKRRGQEKGRNEDTR